MNLRIPALCLIISFALLLSFSVVAGIMESKGITQEDVGPAGVIATLLLSLILFVTIGFSMIPLGVRFFIKGQIKIGNGELPPIKWLRENERTAVYLFWGVIGLGLLIGLPVALVDWYRDILST